jgi:chemotaxis signal transduction protein
MFSSTKVKQAKAKVFVFQVGNLMFGARLESVLKVIPMPTLFKSGEKLLGVTNFEDQEVLVVDLCQQVFDRPLEDTKGFLLILVATTLYGVTVPTLPVLREVLLTDIHPIPSGYRDRDSLGIASHMIQIMDKEIAKTVFLIDTDLLLQLADAGNQQI